MYTPYWYQKEAIESIFKHFKTNKENPLIVAPTGSGKSIIIACFCEKVIRCWPGQKILILSDNQDILLQDYKTIKKQIPGFPIGVYSSGLRSKTIKNLTVAGIQTIYNKPELFHKFNLILVDEAHKIPYSRKGRYHTFFKVISKPVVGFTATPFRLECGSLVSGSNPFFSKIIYEIDMDVLVKDNKLSPVTAKEPRQKMDVSKIKKVAGEFSLSDLSLKFDRQVVTNLILDELVEYYPLRKKWLLYAIDTKHADHIAEGLTQRGIETKALHTRVLKTRTTTLKEFKQGNFPAIVSVAMLTTGIDIPDVDLIGLLRPTASLSLHIQIIGRGTRKAQGKENCLVLDFAGNLLRNGPINKPVVKNKELSKGGGQSIMKSCPECFEIVHIAVRTCPDCNFKFEFQHHLNPTPTTFNPLELKELHWFKVEKVLYKQQKSKKNQIPMLMANYHCGLRIFKDYVCLEHDSQARHIAVNWWKRRCSISYLVPENVSEALRYVSKLKKPKKLLVNTSFKFPQIKEYKF